jgi:hypothetical protein
MRSSITQKTRFILLLVEVAILFVVSRSIFGAFLPPPGDKGFWFYTALLGLLMGSRLDTPFFAKPADVILYAAPAAISLALADSRSQWSDAAKIAYGFAVIYCITVGTIGAFAILTVGSHKIKWQKSSNIARILAETLGSPQLIFTFVISFALFAFHSDSKQEVVTIFLAWVLTAMVSPLEGCLRLVSRVRKILQPGRIVDADGEVVAYQTPQVMLIRRLSIGKIEKGDIVAVSDPLGGSRLALALDYVGRDEGILVRAIEVSDAEIPENLQDQITVLLANSVAKTLISTEAEDRSRLLSRKNALVGLVAPDTSIERLFFEVVNEEGLEEGRLVEVEIGPKTVTYQLVNGTTKEEIVQQKNTHGYARAQAQKIGEWDPVAKRFRFVKWLPRPNSPVFLKPRNVIEPSVEAIGHFPGTNYPIWLKDINQLVTHNTAILGILGVGKSMLAIELVERMMVAGIKVVCLDLTNQYASELSDYYNTADEERRLSLIRQAGTNDFQAWAENPEQGGSLPALRQAIQADLTHFLATDNSAKLKVYNPSDFTVSRQLTEPRSFQNSGQWQRAAPLWTVTPVEITRVVSETVLQLLQDRMSATARVCLVYEEAHSLVPEFSAVASPSDREATNGTARAILQGRKFGLGCLIVTQRTANVTKTILNQCNTVFAMRTFDETGKEFLSNYIGSDYAAILPSLEERHAVIFGRGSSCENPVLIRVNDRPDFLRVFRQQFPPPPI